MSQLPPTIPVCYRHPGRETYVRCTRCERPICPDCMRDASVGHHCPECVADGRRTQRAPRTAFGGRASGRRGLVTKALISLNVLMLLATVVSAGSSSALAGGSGMSWLRGGTTDLHRWGAVLGYATYDAGGAWHGIAAGEYHRLLTAMFIHFGVLHLLMNMWALWILGSVLEEALGPARFLALYLVAGLGGDVAAYVFSAQNKLTAGASGAIFGLFAALFVVMRRLGRDTSSVVPILVVNLVFTFAVPGISVAGHLGGLATGAVVALGLAYAPRSARTAVQVTTVVGVLVVLAVLVVARGAALTG